MNSRTLRLGAMALGAALFTVASTPAFSEEAARPAPEVATGPRAVAMVSVVRIRDLITPAERQTYRQAMRDAKTVADRQRIRQTAMERLSQRAAEHGTIMMIDARMMRHGQRWSEHEAPPLHPAPGR